MKTFLLSCLLLAAIKISTAQPYTIPWAEQQPAWVFPLWFECGDGQRDTIYLCYDPTADNFSWNTADTVFGESFFEVDTSKFQVSLDQFSSTHNFWAIKTAVFNGLPSVSIVTWKAKLPVKIKWDRHLFYDTTLLSIPIPNQLPNPLFEIKLFCNDFDPNYINCGANYPIFWVPEDNIGCCPDPYGLGIKTDSMLFYGDTAGPLSFLLDPISLTFQIYSTWIGIDAISNNIFKIAPTLFSNFLFIDSKLENIYSTWLFDIQGRALFSEIEIKGRTKIEFDNDLPSGLYILEIQDGDNQYFFKVLKTHSP